MIDVRVLVLIVGTFLVGMMRVPEVGSYGLQRRVIKSLYGLHAPDLQSYTVDLDARVDQCFLPGLQRGMRWVGSRVYTGPSDFVICLV